MKPKLLLTLTALLALADAARAQGTAFTYQGRLTDGPNAANGSYDLTFVLFDAASGGSQVPGPLTLPGVAVSNGLFTVTLAFPAGAGAFPGADRWLEIGARTNGAAAFVTLTPRQGLTPSPYAIFAGTSALANSAAPGSVTASSLAANAITTPSIACGTVVRSLNGLMLLVVALARKGLGLRHPIFDTRFPWAWRAPPYAIGGGAAFWLIQRIAAFGQ